jgi:hypothetical protein
MTNWELEVSPRGPNAEDRDILRRLRPARKMMQREKKALLAAIAAERLEQLARDAERRAAPFSREVKRIVAVELPAACLRTFPPCFASWEPRDGGWVGYSRVVGRVAGLWGRRALAYRRASRQAADVAENYEKDKKARAENEMDSYPFCRVCHGAGGREIPASHLFPREYEECSVCGGKTSRCKNEWCRCCRSFEERD